MHGISPIETDPARASDRTVSFQTALGRLGDATAKLVEQNHWFELALEHMSHGLVMVDGDDRIVVCSSRFRDFYGLAADQAKPGMTMREVIRHSIAAGNHPGFTVETLVAARAERLAQCVPVYFDVMMPSGRILNICTQPTESGGAVTVYADVTERRLAESALREQNQFFDGALANMSQGLCMFDGYGRLVVHNRRYLELFRLPEGALRPGLTQAEIVSILVARGCYDDGVAAGDVMGSAQRAIGTRSSAPILRELADGRVIAACYSAMAEGGWVATFDDVTERCRSEERIAHMARHDSLTELPNRIFLRELLEEAAGVTGERLVALFFFDLDRFKAVNDTLGHVAGDALLRQLSERLRAGLRPGEMAARLGGDEFALLQVGGRREDLAGRGEALIRTLGAPYSLSGYPVEIGVSVGVAILEPEDRDLDRLLQNADVALYRAKAEGRGRVRIFEPAMDAEARARRVMEIELREALARGDFELHYQPLLHLASGDVTGFEALVRWRHSERGLIAPARFISLAEETGLVAPLGEWVLRRACRDAATWPDGLGVAVNLSAAQMRNPGFALVVASTLAETGLHPGRLELEITETVLLDDSDGSLSVLHRLRDLGVRIALDDFGTGYSSLSYLRKFPFDKIKIDRSFTRELPECQDSAAIVRAICGLGASLGIATLAEGVETAEQLAAVRAEGCTAVQGYLISKPRPLAEIAGFLADQRRSLAA